MNDNILAFQKIGYDRKVRDEAVGKGVCIFNRNHDLKGRDSRAF